MGEQAEGKQTGRRTGRHFTGILQTFYMFSDICLGWDLSVSSKP